MLGPHIVNFPINLSQALAQKVPIRTQARACTILPEFVGYCRLLYLSYVQVTILST
jgi:ribosomal protein S19